MGTGLASFLPLGFNLPGSFDVLVPGSITPGLYRYEWTCAPGLLDDPLVAMKVVMETAVLPEAPVTALRLRSGDNPRTTTTFKPSRS